MQYARTVEDGKLWEASVFAQLSVGELEKKRRNLICTECGEFAWFRKESLHGHPAHFCAHHAEGCSLRVEYVVVDEPRDEATNTSDQVGSGDDIVVYLDKEKGGVVDVTQVQPSPDGNGDGGGTRFVRASQYAQSKQHFTLRKILHRLVTSEAFRDSESEITFYRDEQNILLQGAVRNVVVELSSVTKHEHHDRLMMFWGPVASVGRTGDGRLWLNSTSRKLDASIMIYENIVDQFLKLFSINDVDEDLLGSYVLVYGRCYYSASGKAVIRCSTPKYIFVRRYREAAPAT